jgi:lysophospholipase L1-like esterase
MFCARHAWVVVLCVAVAACSKTPTGPTASPAPSQIVLGNQPATSAPTPPRLTINPPRAVGVTRIVAFGDSITWGAYSSFDPRFLFAADNGGYVERLRAGLNAYHAPQQFAVFNEGVPGEWASDPRTLTRLRSTLIARQAQAVLLLEGINDLNNGNGISRTITGLGQLVNAATSLGVPVILATMYQTYQTTGPDGVVRTNGANEVPAYNAQIRQLAVGRLNVHVLDLEPLMRNRAFVGADGLHLTDAGFEVMASAFLSAIETAFPVRGSIQ